jgi:hypothetical protein
MRRMPLTRPSNRSLESSNYRGDRSPFEWLTGIHLPDLFDMYFEVEPNVDRNPDRSADDRPADGPYIRFAEISN